MARMGLPQNGGHEPQPCFVTHTNEASANERARCSFVAPPGCQWEEGGCVHTPVRGGGSVQLRSDGAVSPG